MKSNVNELLVSFSLCRAELLELQLHAIHDALKDLLIVLNARFGEVQLHPVDHHGHVLRPIGPHPPNELLVERLVLPETLDLQLVLAPPARLHSHRPPVLQQAHLQHDLVGHVPARQQRARHEQDRDGGEEELEVLLVVETVQRGGPQQRVQDEDGPVRGHERVHLVVDVLVHCVLAVLEVERPVDLQVVRLV